MKPSGLGTDPLRRDSSSQGATGDIPVGPEAETIVRPAGNRVLRGSLGLVEVRGFVPMVVAVDAMAKAANVDLMGYEAAGDGIVAVLIQGDVGAVRHAVEAGADAARRVGEVLSTSVVARPDSTLAEVVPMTAEDLRDSRVAPRLTGLSI